MRMLKQSPALCDAHAILYYIGSIDMDVPYLARKATNVLHVTEFMPLDPFDFFRHATAKLKGNENYN